MTDQEIRAKALEIATQIIALTAFHLHQGFRL